MRLFIRLSLLVWLMIFACAGNGIAALTRDLSVYDDSFRNGFQSRYWLSLSPTNAAPVHSGQWSILVHPTNFWEGIYFHHAGFDTTPYSSLSFWVHATNDLPRLQVQGLFGTSNPPRNVYYRFTVLRDEWRQVTIPLADLGIHQSTNCTGFWIQLTSEGVVGNSNGGFYIDDVQLNAGSAEIAAAEADAVEGAVGPSSSVSPMPVAPAQEQGGNWTLAAWCIAAALMFMTLLLGWLVFMLRRSGLGTPKALVPFHAASLNSGDGHELAQTAESGQTPGSEVVADLRNSQLREKVAAELAQFAKQSLIQGLYAQRNELMNNQQKAEEELAAMEARLAMLQLPLQERIRAYESRIGELEKQLETRDQEVRDMIQATLMLVRDRLEKEKAKEKVGSRLN